MATEKREAPVSFRPGKLRTLLQQRALGKRTEGQIAKRDLGRYYLLISEALRGATPLTRSEAYWLMQTMVNQEIEDLMMGDPFVPEHVNPSNQLTWMVDRALRDAHDRKRDPSVVATRVRSKIAAMTPLERAALMDGLDRLPIESEEDLGLHNWEFIGLPLVDDDAAEA